MRLIGRASRPLSAAGHPIQRPRPVLRAAALLAIVAGAACHDTDLASAPRLAPDRPALVLTGGSGTDLFAIAEPGTTQDEGIPFGLNGVGQVTGTWHPRTMPGADAKVFRWSAGTGAVLVSGCCGGDQAGLDINDSGVITGRSFGAGAVRRAFRAVDNAVVNLPTLSGNAFDVEALGVAINNAGQIAGWSSQGAGFPRHAVVWSASDVIQDLGTLGGTASEAVDINNAGQVIGWSQTTNNAATHWFLWPVNGVMQDLNVAIDASISSVVEINDAGQITGTYVAPNGQTHAFLYTPGSGLRDLGTLGGTTSAPTGLNNKGDVVGSSSLADGSTHAFLWTQTDGMEDITAVTGVPEVKRLNDNRQTLTGTKQYGPRQGVPMPRLVQLTVTSSGNEPPVASFTADCGGQGDPNRCVLDGGASSDDVGIVAYKWSLGDGHGSTSPTADHTYTAGGTYTVTLTVTDAGGLTGTASKQITVGTPANLSPSATISRPIPGSISIQGSPVAFAGTGSDPEDGQLSGASLVWTSDTDGVLGTGNSFTTNTLSVGSHTITLTVTDSKGATGTASTSVEVFASNGAPKADFTFTCSNLTCSFDATSSTDDKGIVSYEWDLNKYPGPYASGPTVTTTYPHEGTRYVTLTVTDANNVSSSITKSFDPGAVVTPPTDAPPVARFTYSCAGTVCALDASTSTDDVGISSYAWSLGKAPDGTATGVTVTTDYWHTSTRTVTLSVTDTKGQTNSVTGTVVVP